MSRLTVSKIEAATAACIIMGFCTFSFLAATFLVYIGTKVFITYACTPMVTPGSDKGPSADIGQTCDNIADLTESSGFMGYSMLRDVDPFGSIVSLITCWMILILIISLNIPQMSAAWDLLRATTLSKKKNKKATELALVWTWRHQDLQNTIIFVELLITLIFSATMLVAPQGSEWEQLEWVVSILIKVLTGRVFCAFFVEIYFHEQLLSIFYSRESLELPEAIKRKLEKEYDVGESQNKEKASHKSEKISV